MRRPIEGLSSLFGLLKKYEKNNEMTSRKYSRFKEMEEY